MAEPAAAHAWPLPAPRRRALRWGAVLLAHALLVLLWRSATGPVQVSVNQRPDARVLQLLALRPVAPPIAGHAPQHVTTAPTARPPVAIQHPQHATETTAAPPLAAPRSEPTLSLLPEPPASAPRQERLLDNAATRQAIRDAARGPLLSERAAAATGIAPTTASGRLSSATEGALAADCMAPQESGPGLLALPFLLAAAAAGKCAH
ncbi:MAG TPA: hypothetical protein VLA61_02030 [Ideonella sp.]|uniref:hypothetical protein n=1 Tax=Ideonella sp. TaxID=1929293 RepID=UPI002C5EBCB6|nr:hypothetical protein [Ideonella sp.]HSI47029.1 hypothetical protein [Ideonella sp.]